MKKSLLQKLLLTALFATLTAAGAMLRIGSASLQTMFATLSGALLGPVWGPVSQLLYLFMGLIGLPIFLEGGGPSYIVNPGFGFIVGMVLSSFVSGILTERTNWNIWIVSALSLVSVYLIGIPYYYCIHRFYNVDTELTVAMALINMTMFIPGDILKLVVVAPVSDRLLPILRKDLYE